MALNDRLRQVGTGKEDSNDGRYPPQAAGTRGTVVKLPPPEELQDYLDSKIAKSQQIKAEQQLHVQQDLDAPHKENASMTGVSSPGANVSAGVQESPKETVDQSPPAINPRDRISKQQLPECGQKADALSPISQEIQQAAATTGAQAVEADPQASNMLSEDDIHASVLNDAPQYDMQGEQLADDGGLDSDWEDEDFDPVQLNRVLDRLRINTIERKNNSKCFCYHQAVLESELQKELESKFPHGVQDWIARRQAELKKAKENEKNVEEDDTKTRQDDETAKKGDMTGKKAR